MESASRHSFAVILRSGLPAGVVLAALLCPSPVPAQELPPAGKAARVRIKEEPALELARDDWVIIRWIADNPGGLDDHFAVIKFGTDPGRLDHEARSHIRLNRSHAETIFRVSVSHLSPGTTYFYKVTSVGSDGSSDGAESSVLRFTTPDTGKEIVAFPKDAQAQGQPDARKQ